MVWRLAFLFLAFPACLVQGQTTGPRETLEPFSKSSGHCGYKDRTGRVVIEPKLGRCSHFSEGVALVQERGKLWGLQQTLDVDRSSTDWGYIDETGKYLFQFKPRDYLPGGDFTEGFAPIYDVKTRKYGYIDRSGKIAVPPQFDHAESFSDGLAVVCSGEYHRPGQGYWLTRGEAVKMAGRRCGFADHSGQLVIPYRWAWVEGFHEGMARFVEDRKFGFIDKTGKIAIPAQFTGAGAFNEGLAAAAKDYVYGYIDPIGRFVIPPQFKSAGPFSQGLAAVATGTLQEKFSGFEISPFYLGHQLVYGYIDRQANMVIAPEFLSADPFLGGRAAVTAMHATSLAGSDVEDVASSPAMILRDGTFDVPPVFNRITVHGHPR
jgi:hypothetical protein